MTIARSGLRNPQRTIRGTRHACPHPNHHFSGFRSPRLQRRALGGDRVKGSIEMEPNVEAKESAPAPRVQEGAQLRAVKAAEPKPPANSKSAVMRLRIILGALVLLAVVSGWWGYARQFEDTDDAQTDANISAISPRIPGTVVAVHVADNQSVKAGDLLVEQDRNDLEIPGLDRLVVHHVHRNHGPRNPRADRADIRVGLSVVGVLKLARVAPPAAHCDEEYQGAKDDAQPHHRGLALGWRLRFGRLYRPQLGSLLYPRRRGALFRFDIWFHLN